MLPSKKGTTSHEHRPTAPTASRSVRSLAAAITLLALEWEIHYGDFHTSVVAIVYLLAASFWAGLILTIAKAVDMLRKRGGRGTP